MKPNRSILDESFRYVPAAATSVAETWRRFGWHPTTNDERKARRLSAAEIVVVEVDEVAPVRPIRRRLPGAQGEVVQRRELAVVTNRSAA